MSGDARLHEYLGDDGHAPVDAAAYRQMLEAQEVAAARYRSLKARLLQATQAAAQDAAGRADPKTSR